VSQGIRRVDGKTCRDDQNAGTGRLYAQHDWLGQIFMRTK